MKQDRPVGKAGQQIVKIRVITGVYWISIPSADLNILCGCPADSVKHLIKLGLVVPVEYKGVSFETGPNAILLSDKLIQNGQISNLSEFPVLQMLYRQGLILPGHPNNTGHKPLLIGTKEQVEAQKAYIFRGNYGLNSKEEILATGVDENTADLFMEMKLKFAFGRIRKTEELIDVVVVNDSLQEIRNGVYIKRRGVNLYEFTYKGESVSVDLNLKPGETYETPYPLGYHQVDRDYFSVIHSGEGDGWDINRPCMASILIFQGKPYLIDAGPNICSVLKSLGIDISELEGIFHTHAHDDHFAGLPTLACREKRLKYYATSLVRASVAKKFAAIMGIKESEFYDYFDVNDLAYETWNIVNGLEVLPIISPHPVETNIFYFRAFWENGYRSYAHLADITSKEVLDGMLIKKAGDTGIPGSYLEKVQAEYLRAVDLKKIDIGGGLIHGNAVDFKSDPSRKIILAHKATPLTNQEKAIGSNATFGAIDVLIRSERNYLKIKAEKYLKEIFEGVDPIYTETILNCPIVSFNPGTVLISNNHQNKRVYLLLTGTVEYINPETHEIKTVRTGNFIGDADLFDEYHPAGIFRTASYIQTIELTEDLYLFVKKHCP